MTGSGRAGTLVRMPRYLVHHRHSQHECGVAFASFRGHESPLFVAERASATRVREVRIP
jgi:hypothetical protein